MDALSILIGALLAAAFFAIGFIYGRKWGQ
jgi:hypothetical protein